MDIRAVDGLRRTLAGTGWVERTAELARSLRTAGHSQGGLLLVGTVDDEPWHLTAHLDEQARYAGLPELAPTLVRHVVPPGAPAHLAVDLSRIEAVGRGQTLLVVAPQEPDEHLLQRVSDARRRGGVLLSMAGTAGSELAGLSHDGLVVDPAMLSVDTTGHLVSAAAGQRPSGRTWWRRGR